MLGRLGIGFIGHPYSVEDIIDHVKKAELAGFESAWVSEECFLRDPITIVAGLALSTVSMKLGTGVINPYTRNPVSVAQTIATLDEISHGRMILGIGTGVGPLIKQMGIEFEKPLTKIRESVYVIRELMAGKEVNYRGQTLNIKRIKLEAPYFKLMGEFNPLRTKIPIYVAAIGPRMLQLAGEIADGVLLTAGCSSSEVKGALENIKIGAEKVGRDYRNIDVAAYILTTLLDGKKESEVLKGFLAVFLASEGTEYLLRAGFTKDEVEHLRKTVVDKGVEGALPLITKEIVDTFSACGNVPHCISKIKSYVQAGVMLPIILPIDTNVKGLISALRDFVT